MQKDFLQLFNESNSIKNEDTNEITITSSLITAEGEYQIKSPCIITSNSQTIIKCNLIEVLSPSVSFTNISFETSIITNNADNFSINNCNIKSTVMSAEAVIVINSSYNVSIKNSKVTGSLKIVGIYINLFCSVVIENTEINNLSGSLLTCFGNSNLVVKKCNLHHTESNGIYIEGQNSVQVVDCKITDTSFPSIFALNSNCSIINNEIRNCEQDAIVAHSSPQFRIENNKISNIKSSAISARAESNGIICNNTISCIKGNGVFNEFSDVEIINNKISDLEYPGIATINKGKSTIIGNKINNIKLSAIVLRNAIFAKILNNEINIAECGISISNSEKCIIKNNQITNCGILAVESYNKSNVFIKNNNISKVGKYAFLAYIFGYIKAENNQIDQVGDVMSKLVFKGSGEFENNKVSNCPNQCENKTSSPYFYAKNGKFDNITNIESRANESIKFEQPIEDDKNILCLKCNKNQRDCYIIECCHKVYCKKCAQDAMKNNEKCPLCRFEIKNVSEGFGMNRDDLCILCEDNKPDSIILPCGHTGVCSDCLNNWFKESNVCPCCRTENCTYKRIDSNL